METAVTAAKSSVPKHLALSRYLTDLAYFWGLVSCISAIGIFFTHPGVSVPQGFFYILWLCLLPGFHGVTAWGCKRKSEVARHVAKFIGFMMFMAVPIGTLLSLSYLPLTDWDEEHATGQQEAVSKP
jgi:hypothetical protein